jgi:hypothetical protein
MTDKDIAKDGKKHLIATVPAILTGSAALVAALTTTYVSLRDGKSEASAKPETAVVAPAANPPNAAGVTLPQPDSSAGASVTASVPVQAVATSQERSMMLGVERIAVHRDGTSGATNWRFAVEVDGEPRFAFEQERLTDEGGRNIAFPKDAFTRLRLAQGKPAKIVVKGWKISRFHAAAPQPDAQGEGRLDPAGKPEAIQVSAAEPDLGSFTFYFSADATEGDQASAIGDTLAGTR